MLLTLALLNTKVCDWDTVAKPSVNRATNADKISHCACCVAWLSCWRMVVGGPLYACMHACMQAETRGVDRIFRLFREDQIAGIRDALEAADGGEAGHAPRRPGPKPIKFEDARLEDVMFSRPGAPLFKLSFDVPRRVQQMRAADLVRCMPLHDQIWDLHAHLYMIRAEF